MCVNVLKGVSGKAICVALMPLCSSLIGHAATPLGPTQGAQQFSPEQRSVIAASVARRDAMNRRDIVAAAHYITDDCVFSDDNGGVLTKQEYLQHLGKFPAAYDQTSNPRDYLLRMHGATAVLNFRVTDTEQFGESRIVNEQRRTETWLRTRGSWRLAAAQWDNLPLNYRQPAAADTLRYPDYVGRYEWRPGDLVDEVVSRDGKLLSKIGEETDEYLPLGGEAFFIRADLGSVTFARDVRNAVTGYVYRRSDGQELFARKLSAQ